jgi:hypothetical protein
MGRFYFHICEGGQLTTDDEGVDLPNLTAARREAELSAREMLADAIKSGKKRVPDAFVIADEEGRTLDTLPLSAVLPEPFKK